MQEQAAKLSKILFCTDFSDNAMVAFKYALEAARLLPESELKLLHVLPEPDAQFWKSYIYEVGGNVDDEAKKAIDALVAKDYRPLIPENIRFSVEFRIGKAPAKIIEYAEEWQAGMIVIGRQGSGALNSLLYGSVAEKVVKKAGCPVLVIPMK